MICRSIMNENLNLLREVRMNFKCEKCYSMQTKMKLIIFDFILTNFSQPRPVNVLINFLLSADRYNFLRKVQQNI